MLRDDLEPLADERLQPQRGAMECVSLRHTYRKASRACASSSGASSAT
jgi:hypothetical protein